LGFRIAREGDDRGNQLLLAGVVEVGLLFSQLQLCFLALYLQRHVSSLESDGEIFTFVQAILESLLNLRRQRFPNVLSYRFRSPCLASTALPPTGASKPSFVDQLLSTHAPVRRIRLTLPARSSTELTQRLQSSHLAVG